jgi:coenzyme F420-0:L-glutamate ligase / coenzyme F420-1:gamma-L-glutamate ligase
MGHDDVRILAVRGIGEVLTGALERQGTALLTGDVVVVTQKIVSKAEGRIIDLRTVTPSEFARRAAAEGQKDPAYYEVVLRESRRVVRMTRGVLVTETHHGFVCANSGVDESNVAGGAMVVLLPVDPDGSARTLRAAFQTRTGADVAVIISDSFGRAWREGQVNVAIGCAGMTLRASNLAVADELASAAELVMGKIDQVPVAIIRGYAYAPSEGGAGPLVRPPERDLFR